MTALWLRALLTCAALAMSSVVTGQSAESSAFFRRLPVHQVTESEGHIYVRVQDQRRGATQALERILINRATVLAGHWLCRYTPKANQRLDTNLRGLNLIYSQENEGVLDVVIKLKKQQPECVIQTVASRPEPLSAPATADTAEVIAEVGVQAPTVQKASKPPATPVPPASGFKVRVYSTEH